jgi:hypothetical protein
MNKIFNTDRCNRVSKIDRVVCHSLSSSSGFTMLEVLFAGLVLAMSTFTVLGLLKISDEMSYRAKADAKVSQLFKTRSTILVKGPFENLRQIAVNNDPNATTHVFQSGFFRTNQVAGAFYHTPPTGPFPFFDAVDPLGGSVAPSDMKNLLQGKPIPGDTNFRSIFPFIEQVVLEFNNAPNASPSSVKVRYSLTWLNEFIRSTQRPDVGGGGVDYNKLRIFDFYFVKYDPSRL